MTITINKLKPRISENAHFVKRYNNCYMCFPKPRHDIRENPLSKVKAPWWIWNNWNKKSCIEQNRTKNKFHINTTGFMKIGDGSSWDSVFTDHLLATSVDRKTDINMQILNRGNNLLLRKTSICPPYWNANSKALEPSLLLAPDCVDSAVVCAFPWKGSYLPPFIYQFLDSFS